mgnify:CR=1 FL=1
MRAACPHEARAHVPPRSGGGGLASAAKAALRGVEPELFNPEDLLAVAGGDNGSVGAGGAVPPPQRPGLASIPASSPDAGGKSGWFSGLFGGRGGGGDTASDPGQDDGVLKRPPPVRCAAREKHMRGVHCTGGGVAS